MYFLNFELFLLPNNFPLHEKLKLHHFLQYLIFIIIFLIFLSFQLFNNMCFTFLNLYFYYQYFLFLFYKFIIITIIIMAFILFTSVFSLIISICAINFIKSIKENCVVNCYFGTHLLPLQIQDLFDRNHNLFQHILLIYVYLLLIFAQFLMCQGFT